MKKNTNDENLQSTNTIDKNNNDFNTVEEKNINIPTTPKIGDKKFNQPPIPNIPNMQSIQNSQNLHNPLSKSMPNKNKVNNSKLSINNNKALEKTLQNIDNEIYKKYLEKTDNYDDINFEDFEKHVETLQNDKNILEEFLNTSRATYNPHMSEKYKIIKTYYEKYLELINDKLIENIEQNMILKFNMKELLDLNTTNNNHMTILFSQITNLETLKLENPSDQVEEEVNQLKEEMKNIQMAIEENDRIKERISTSLAKNLKLKKIFKKILVKLISNKTYDNKTTNFEQAYKNLVKEKEDLESKNNKFKKMLNEVIKEKEVKETKLTEVQKELENVKKLLKQKDTELNSIKKRSDSKSRVTKKSKISSDSDNSIDNNKDESKQKVKEENIERIEINLHDDYFDKNVDKSEKRVIDENEKNNIHSIRYIINQTNNIVNNNINKIIKKEEKEREMQISKRKEEFNMNPKLIVNKSTQLADVSSSNKAVKKRKSTLNINSINNSQNFPIPKPIKKLSSMYSQSSITNDKDSSNYKRKRSQSKSPRSNQNNLNPQQNQNKKEFDKIIESQLNDVYNKKARELGDKMKKNFKNSSMSSYSNHNNNFQQKKQNLINKIKPISYNNNVLDTLKNEEMEEERDDNKRSLNRSLSISCVSLHQEIGLLNNELNSELDIVEHIENISNNLRRSTSTSNVQNFEAPHNSNLKKSFNIEKIDSFLDKNIERKGNSKLNLRGSVNIEKNYNNNNHNFNFNTRSISSCLYSNNPYSSLTPLKNNKNTMMNVQKFLNMNQNIDKPVVIPQKRDYSPGLLKQARLERHLTRNVQSTSECASICSKKIIKNAEAFINDYSNNKKVFFKTESEDGVGVGAGGETFRNKEGIVNDAINSLIHYMGVNTGQNITNTEANLVQDHIEPVEQNEENIEKVDKNTLHSTKDEEIEIKIPPTKCELNVTANANANVSSIQNNTQEKFATDLKGISQFGNDMFSETESISQSQCNIEQQTTFTTPEDLFKSLNDVIKNPKVSRFLDKK